MVTFEPGRKVDQQRKTGGMGFGKTVTAKTLDLVKEACGKSFIMTTGQHAIYQLITEFQQIVVAPPNWSWRGVTGQPAPAEARRNHSQTNDLLLENGDAQGALQHTPDCFTFILNRFQTITAL